MTYQNSKIFKFLNKDKAFTLVEMLVAILIFSIIIGAATGVFISAIRMQRYNLTYQQMLDQTSYAMEYMSRAIRMAQKDTGAECIATAGKNYELIGDSSLEFKTYKSPTECWRFFLDNKHLKINKGGTVYYLITSSKFEVTSLKFNVLGDEAEKQPRVTIFMEIQGKDYGSQPKIRIQTTISQRNL